MPVRSVEIINRPNNQSKFQMFTLFTGRHVGAPTPLRLHFELSKFLRNISTNICGLGKRTDQKLGRPSSLFISSNITIS